MRLKVVLDACVLLPYQLADLMLHLAEKSMFTVLWSDELLDEVRRNLIAKFDVSADKADRRLAMMAQAFPGATVHGYKDLIPGMTNHVKDRHVLAAAVRAGADLIVTANLKDFPLDALARFGIEAIHPDEFLLDILDLHPMLTITTLDLQQESYGRPPLTKEEFRETLRVVAPGFVDGVTQAERRWLDPDLPLPIVAVSEEVAYKSLFPEGQLPDATTALGAAFLWYMAMKNLGSVPRPALDRLVADPRSWDHQTAALDVADLGLVGEVHPTSDVNIRHVMLIDGISAPARSFSSALLEKFLAVTLVRSLADRRWRVCRLTRDAFPPVHQIRSEVTRIGECDADPGQDL